MSQPKISEIFEKIAITEEQFQNVCAELWQKYLNSRVIFGELHGITTDGTPSAGWVIQAEQRARKFMVWGFQDEFTAPDRIGFPQPETQRLLIDGLPRIDGVWVGWNSADFKSFESRFAELIFVVDIEKLINWHHPKLHKISEIPDSVERFLPIINMIDPLREEIAAFKMSCSFFSHSTDLIRRVEADLIVEINRLLGCPMTTLEHEVLWVAEDYRFVRLYVTNHHCEEGKYESDIGIEIRKLRMSWLPYQLESYGRMFYDLCEAKIKEIKAYEKSGD